MRSSVSNPSTTKKKKKNPTKQKNLTTTKNPTLEIENCRAVDIAHW
jgi:hypothetical protein